MHKINAGILKDQIETRKNKNSFANAKMSDTEYAMNKEILSKIKI